jgi:hypothetical protein
MSRAQEHLLKSLRRPDAKTVALNRRFRAATTIARRAARAVLKNLRDDYSASERRRFLRGPGATVLFLDDRIFDWVENDDRRGLAGLQLEANRRGGTQVWVKVPVDALSL